MVFMSSVADHVSGVDGASLTITASKDGGAFSAITPTVTGRGSGWYNLALTGAHLDTLGDFAIHVTAAACDPSDLVVDVVAYDPEDAAGLGLTRVDAAITTRAQETTLTTRIPTALSFTGANVNADAKVTVAPADMALNSTVAKAATAVSSADLTPTRAGKLDNLDVVVSTRATPADVLAQAGSALTTYDPPTKGEMDAAFLALNDVSVADVLAGVIEGTLTLGGVLRVMLSALAGKAAGGGTTTIKFRDQGDLIDRITATVDSNGNRTTVVVDGT